MFYDANYLSHFVRDRIILARDVDHITSLPGRDRAVCVLNNITASLEGGNTQSFYKMLEIMQSYGTLHAQEVANDILKLVSNVVSVVPKEGTYVHMSVAYVCKYTINVDMYST